MRLTIATAAFLLAACSRLVAAAFSPAAERPTWVEIHGVVYGAKADNRGPIGGGGGYTNIVTRGDFTTRDLESLVEALSKAKAGQVVFIPGDAEIDLTTRVYIDQLVLEVPAGVTLASDRGHHGSAGALLTSDALKTPIMIRAMGPKVRITGLRIRGPNPKRYLEHYARAFGPGGGRHADYYKFPTQDGIRTDHDGLKVDNCDLSGFGHAGVYLHSGKDHHIHHNFIHHCQYQGLGYGVCHDTASSLIEYNLFDWNRHSIAGSGRPGCQYVARHNVQLGTSLHDCFDVHGGRDREDGTEIAGTIIEIYNNTFRAPQRPIYIGGVPQEKSEVHHNWFPKHPDRESSVRASEKTIVRDNAYGEEKPKVVK
jgi:hypothetical protein